MQPTAIQTEDTLRFHIELCEKCYTLLQSENAHLKHEQSPPSAELLEQKKQLLEQLENSNQKLKTINESSTHLTATQKQLAQDAQKKIMKIFLLDRENEQLLLKFSVTQQQTPALPQQSNPDKVRDAYEIKN